MNKAQRMLKEAERLAASATTWADFSNDLFDPQDGLLSKEYPLGPARTAFIKTEEYRLIHKLLEDLMERTGAVEGATPRKSGKFMVRLPSSLHAALEREAGDEGVSLNQLVVAKLSKPLKSADKPRSAAGVWKTH